MITIKKKIENANGILCWHIGKILSVLKINDGNGYEILQ